MRSLLAGVASSERRSRDGESRQIVPFSRRAAMCSGGQIEEFAVYGVVVGAQCPSEMVYSPGGFAEQCHGCLHVDRTEVGIVEHHERDARSLSQLKVIASFSRGVGQELAQLSSAPVEPGCDGSNGRVHDLGDLRARETRDIGVVHRDAELFGQRPHRRLDGEQARQGRSPGPAETPAWAVQIAE